MGQVTNEIVAYRDAGTTQVATVKMGESQQKMALAEKQRKEKATQQKAVDDLAKKNEALKRQQAANHQRRKAEEEKRSQQEKCNKVLLFIISLLLPHHRLPHLHHRGLIFSFISYHLTHHQSHIHRLPLPCFNR
ncbi:hypothetical protein M5689_009327 [Euphorbia peplus]|nr:hypothetical protein M5689_009327 [Euphorbia peplus]